MEIFPFLDGDVPHSTSTQFTFLNLFNYLDCFVMWLTSMHVIKLVHFFNRAIGIINFGKLFLNFIADTMNWFQNSRSD